MQYKLDEQYKLEKKKVLIVDDFDYEVKMFYKNKELKDCTCWTNLKSAINDVKELKKYYDLEKDSQISFQVIETKREVYYELYNENDNIPEKLNQYELEKIAKWQKSKEVGEKVVYKLTAQKEYFEDEL